MLFIETCLLISAVFRWFFVGFSIATLVARLKQYP